MMNERGDSDSSDSGRESRLTSFHYVIPESVRASTLDGRALLATPEGGKIAVDSMLLSLWRRAGGQPLDALLSEPALLGSAPDAIRGALACLAEAGLLAREGVAPEPPVHLRTRGKLVSIIVVSYNSREWLADCLDSLRAQTYSPLEVFVVDNGSQDRSAEWVQANYPSVTLVALKTSESFARSLNCGCARATGEYLLLLNPDVRLEPDAVAHMVRVAEQDPSCAAVAAKLRFWWAPAFLNGMGNRVGPSSWGTDCAWGHLDLGQFDHWQELSSSCFAGTLIPRAAWDRVGPVDEGFPMYYEDSEWCYRARLLGHTVRAAPRAVIYHAFGGRVPTGDEQPLSTRKLRHVVYGRLRFALGVVGSQLRRFLFSYLKEDCANLRRMLSRGHWDSAAAVLAGWFDISVRLPAIWSMRQALQARRMIGDAELFDPRRDLPAPLGWHDLPELTWDSIRTYYLPLMRSGGTRPMPEFQRSTRRPHLLIVSNDVVDVKMAGPGMRYLEMARALSAEIDVTLAVPADSSLVLPDISLVRYWEDRPGSLQVLVDNSDVTLISGYMVDKFPFLQYSRARLVIDLYDPFILENLYYYVNEPLPSQTALNRLAVDVANRLAQLGDYFICGSERQRDFWIGLLTANGRLNPQTFGQDSSLRSLVDVVGIGFPSRPPRARPLLRGVHPAFPSDCRIVLWGGGIWDWLDPLTLVRAWPRVLAKHPDARLVFLGTRHPNSQVPQHKMAAQTETLASEIGEKDRSVFFIEWLGYEEREGLLCESDVGVTLHLLHIETRYSIRTRVLDYWWARLPVVVSDGDVTSEWVRQYHVGQVVPPGEVEATAVALSEMLERPKSDGAAGFESLRNLFEWSHVIDPLKQYCLKGVYAPDRATRLAEPEPPGRSRREFLARTLEVARTEGWRSVLRRATRYVQ